MSTDYIAISNTSLLLTVALMAVVGLIALVNRLGITSSVFVGTIRSFAQLTIMGYVLEWIFDIHKWYYTVLILSVMMFFATRDSYKRIDLKLPRTFLTCLTAMIVGNMLPLAFTFFAVLKLSTWYEPQYVIPISAMVISNTMTAVSLCLNTYASELKTRKLEIETKLSLGATPAIALETIRKSAIKSGLIPTINALMVLGIVKLPGMMTGQILGGVSPIESVKYQLIIMYMISAAAAISLFVLTMLIEKDLFNNRHQLRYDLIN